MQTKRRKILITTLFISGIIISIFFFLNIFFLNGLLDNKVFEIIILIWLFISFALIIFLSSLLFMGKIYSNNSLIKSMNSVVSSQEKILEFGIISFNEDKIITFISPWLLSEKFTKFLGQSVYELKSDLDLSKTKEFIWKFDGRVWKFNVISKNNIILLKNATYTNSLENIIDLMQDAILLLNISYSKNINLNEQAKLKINSDINIYLQKWVSKVEGIYNESPTSNNTISIHFKWLKGKGDILNERFLNEIISVLGEYKNEIIISIGISYGDKSLNELMIKSLKTLQFSINRGGDQIVIEAPNEQISFIGSSQPKNSKISSNILFNIKGFYSKFMKEVEVAKNIILSSHINADLDSIGSLLGIYELIKEENNDIYIVLDNLDSTSKLIYDDLPEDIKNKFITEQEVMKKVNSRSLIIVSDTTLTENTQIKNLLHNFKENKIVVIDHHRKGNNSFNEKPGDLFLIETSASSASELVVELLSTHIGESSIDIINEKISTILLAGIYLDTQNLTKNFTDLTFKMISFLLNNNGDLKFVQDLFKPESSLMEIESLAFKNLIKITDSVYFTFIPEEILLDAETISIMANTLLRYKNINATFVLGKTNNNKFKVSARSDDKINVQLIAEALGGGGHYNMSSATWNSKKTTYDYVKKIIIDAINKGIK